MKGEQMAYQWHFHELGSKESQRESVSDTFFKSNAFESPLQVIVREGIQNALDAKEANTGKVKVRIYLSGSEGALSGETVKKYFDSGLPHWKSKENGLVPLLPGWDGACPFLVIEDFGTSGLTGDESVPHFKKRHEDDSNHFYHFFRAEGQTDKDKGKRGSWGVGKHVFPMNSQVRAFLGYTIRKSPHHPELLMGKTILKKVLTSDAPSMFADSMSSKGNSLNAATSTNAKKGFTICGRMRANSVFLICNVFVTKR